MPFVLNLKPQIVRCVCSQSSINRRLPGRGSLAWAAKKTDADVTTTEVPKKKPGRKKKETIQLEEVIRTANIQLMIPHAVLYYKRMILSIK